MIWADAGYAGRLVSCAWTTGGWLLTVVRRQPDSHHFEALPRRWLKEEQLSAAVAELHGRDQEVDEKEDRR